MSRPPQRGGLSEEEEALWRRVTRTVRPLAGRDAQGAAPSVTPLRAAAPSHRSTHRPVEPRKTAGPLADRSPEKRVRRGKLDVGAKLDLHGHTQEEARAALTRFLLHARADGVRVALVVTGKGARLHAGDAAPGVLRQRLPEWLARPELRPLLSGFAQAHARHGGGGAYYVFLRAGD